MTTMSMQLMSRLRRDPRPTLTAWIPAIITELDELRRQGRLRWIVAQSCTNQTQEGISQIFEHVKLEVILTGTAEVWHQGVWTKVRPGGIMVVPSAVAHRQNCTSDQLWNLGIFVSDDDITMQIVDVVPNIRQVVGGTFKNARGALLQHLVDDVLADSKSSTSLCEQAQSMILSILADAIRRQQAEARGGDFAVQACRKMIENDFADPVLSLGTCAQRLDRKPSALARLFLRKTGLTVNAALRQRRVLAAQRLLLRSTLDVDSIATRCGFARRDSFTRAFRLLANCSPILYRRLGHLEGEVLKDTSTSKYAHEHRHGARTTAKNIQG